MIPNGHGENKHERDTRTQRETTGGGQKISSSHQERSAFITDISDQARKDKKYGITLVQDFFFLTRIDKYYNSQRATKLPSATLLIQSIYPPLTFTLTLLHVSQPSKIHTYRKRAQ